MLEKMAVILIASFKYPMCQLEVRNVGYKFLIVWIEIAPRIMLKLSNSLLKVAFMSTETLLSAS